MSDEQSLIAFVIALVIGVLIYFGWRARQTYNEKNESSTQDTNTAPEKNVTINIHKGPEENSYSFELLEEEKSVKFNVIFPSSPLVTDLSREYLLDTTVTGLPGHVNIRRGTAFAGEQIRMRKAIYEAVMDFENNVEPGSQSGTLDCLIPPTHMFYSLLNT